MGTIVVGDDLVGGRHVRGQRDGLRLPRLVQPLWLVENRIGMRGEGGDVDLAAVGGSHGTAHTATCSLATVRLRPQPWHSRSVSP